MKYIFLVLLVFLVGCASEDTLSDEGAAPEITGEKEVMQEQPMENQNPPTLKELSKVEIREYEGEKLDSIVDVRDLSIKGPQDVDIKTYKLEVSGLVENPKEFTYDEVLSLQKYSKVLELYCVTGWKATVLWEGILLKDLFEEVQPTSEANTVIFYAADGYTTSLPLDYIIDNEIILADKINNVTLPAERGFPFELVAESKLGYKWIKWVTKIELSDDPEYRGYWESRGYSNKADVDGTYTD